jgi:hypothetical protein
MFQRISRSLVAAVATPFALGAHAYSEEEAKRKAIAKVANLSKYKNLILLPGSANVRLAEDIASHLGVELGKMETAR